MGENFSAKSTSPDAYYRIHADECQLKRFWDRFNSRFETAPSPLQIRHLQIAGLAIQLECRSPCLLNYVEIQMAFISV